MVDLGPTDDEGSPDVYRNCINRLKKEGFLDTVISEPLSMDWRAERQLVPSLLDNIMNQPLWEPRIGELVLFVRDLNAGEEVHFDEATRVYKIYRPNAGTFSGLPRWQAGVIAQPSEEPVNLEDLVSESNKTSNVTYSGFRVEAFPDPNGDDKSYSKQYKYLPMHQIRPFSFWQELLHGIPDQQYDRTLRHAFAATSTFSLVEKYHFKGTWPTADVLCRGLYIGSELISVGDIVRLVPADDELVTDILKVTSIKLRFTNLDEASDNDYDDGNPYNSAVHVTGIAFTTQPARAYSSEALPVRPGPSSILHAGFAGYDEFYARQEPGKKTQVPFHRVLGRCYEAEAMALWFPEGASSIDQTADLSKGLSGLLKARKYSSDNYRRIQADKTWFWGDCRTDSLDLETLNSQEVGRRDPDRDPKKWRKELRVIDGVADAAEKASLRQERATLRDARGYAFGDSSLVRSALDHNVGEGPSGRSSSLGKRSRFEQGSMELDGQDAEMEEQDVDAEMEGFVDDIAEGLAFSDEEGDIIDERDSELMADVEGSGGSGKKQRMDYMR